MGVREDGRPTLASWPRRIYDWPELPARFGPALDSWRMRGLPPEHVTYIPKLHQHVSGMEYLAAWLGEEVLLLCDDGDGHLERTLVRRGEVTELTYGVRLLACSAAVALRQDHVQKQVDFRYNKTKEDVLLPVLNLLLGNPPDFRPRQAHPPTEALERLREDSFAMYHMAKLCYRFGEEIRDSLWLQGRSYGAALRRRQKPEYFLAKMDRGVVGLRMDFYGVEAVYLAWDRLAGTEMRRAGPRGRATLVLEAEYGADFAVPLLPEQQERAEAFAVRLSER